MAEANLDLSQDEIDKIVGFLGYGNPCAPVWFIGIEEGLGDANDADLSGNLHARGTFEEVMDLWRAHKLLREEGQPVDIEEEGKVYSRMGMDE